MTKNVEVEKKDADEDDEWVEDPPVEEIVSLEVGENLDGLLIEKKTFTRQDKQKYIYKFQVANSPTTKLLFGSTDLDPKLSIHDIGDELRIERIGNKDTGKGQPMHQFKIYMKKVNKNAEKKTE